MAGKLAWRIITVFGLIFLFFAYVVNRGVRDKIPHDAIWVGYALLAFGLIWSGIGIYKLLQMRKGRNIILLRCDPKWLGVFFIGMIFSFFCWALAADLRIIYFDYLAYVGGIMIVVGFIQMLRTIRPGSIGLPHDDSNNTESEKPFKYWSDDSQKTNSESSVCSLCGGDGKCSLCRFSSEDCGACDGSRKCPACFGSGECIP